ncbi:hypothetical protein GCM10009792_24970 [Microcella alkalica]|uniref:Lysophospholipase L1-like esterase n=1 Tax=Microcella alkalica TaxID=355930 RepID=A0A839EAD9_9MICO|nr:SGNH/GDSL hydrolase family protein [Microcella alkalica]MBA8848133.1 lysophospholipase L1-like esterase [Microcella alkalica]
MPRSTKPAHLAALVALTAVTGTLVALAMQPTTPPESTVAASQPIVREQPTTVAVLGDSNTEVDSVDFAGGQIGAKTWVRELTHGNFRFAGGWADGGATTARIADELTPITADVLLVMAGTNDVGLGVPFEESAANLKTAIAKTTANRTILLAIPPRFPETQPTSADFNLALRAVAAENGWEYFDGHQSTTLEDGVHLDFDSHRALAEAIIRYLEG